MPPDAMPPVLSVVIPLRDEALNVLPLHDELSRVLGALAISYEVLLIDDGSEDETFARLREVQAGDPHVRVFRFTRNFGQTAAFAAGFAHARGRFIATADGDLQNDPADIEAMLALAETHDIVCGWRRNRKDAFLTRRVPSTVANWLLGLVSGIRIHDNGCSLKIFRAEVVKPLRLRHGMHRYLPALASQIGGRVAETVVNHRPRQFGHSKYGLSRTFRVLSDVIHLPRLMQQAIDPATDTTGQYEIAEVLDRRGSGAAGAVSMTLPGEVGRTVG
jgi:glycosyltransferase involved in cell wall biosynthesis